MKRQRGRNRRSNNQGGQSNNPNRSFDSAGPEGIKVRGNAQTVYERYQQLARDATSSGDRVLAENYLQHAEHYFRLLRILQPQRPVTEIAAREGLSGGNDIDFEDESGAQAAAIAAQVESEKAAAQQRPQQSDQKNNRGRNADNDSNKGQSRRQSRKTDGSDASDESNNTDTSKAKDDDKGGETQNKRERAPRRSRKNDNADNTNESNSDNADPLAVIGPKSESDDSSSHIPGFLTRSVGDKDDSEAEAPRRRGRPRRKEPANADDEF